MSSKSAFSSESLLDELQTALANGTVAQRVETLRRVTDLFTDGAVHFSAQQIRLFDDLMKVKGDEPPIGGFWPNELVLRRVAGAWRVDVRSFELSPLRGGMAPDRAVFVLRKGAALAREETGRITAHEYKSAREAKDAIIRHLLESLRESDLATTRPTGGPN